MSSNGYTAVRTIFFNKFDNSPCDLYLKLSDNKVVKILNQNDELGNSFIEKYVSKKIFEFYLTAEDFKTYQDALFDFHSNAKEILVKGKRIALPQHDGMNEMMEELGMDEKQTKQINNISTQIVTDLNTGEHAFSKIIGKFTTNTKRFLYDHSYLTALISCLIASQNEWGTTPNKEKLCLASILHELGDEDQLNLGLDENLLRQDFNDGLNEFQVKVNQRLAEKLKKVPTVSLDVINIIEGYHNFKFPQLSPMTSCFSVAHQFVIELYREKFKKESLPDIFKRMSSIFTEGNPAKQLELLKKAV
jgi:hypothetical protein